LYLYLFTYLLAYLPAYLLTCLLTYLLTRLLTHLLTYSNTYLPVLFHPLLNVKKVPPHPNRDMGSLIDTYGSQFDHNFNILIWLSWSILICFDTFSTPSVLHPKTCRHSVLYDTKTKCMMLFTWWLNSWSCFRGVLVVGLRIPKFSLHQELVRRTC
jgi:hypothetical protein